MIGDLVPVKDRQVAIARWLVAVITGNLLGASLSGVVGDLLGWRGVFFVITGLGVIALGVAIVTLRKAARAKPVQLSLSGFRRGYGSVFANPRAKVCFSAVFIEGIVIFGLFPFVALLLLAAGEPRASIAGAVIAGFSVGGVIYAVAVPWLVARWRPDQLMIGYVITGLGVVALVVAIVSLRKAARAQKATGLSLSGFSRGYGSVFANPRAKICFGAVFVEGIVIFGLFPFVALMLHAAGETRASIAGVVIAGFSLGGVVYALGVPMMVARWRPDQLMIGGGILAAISLAVVAFNVPWQVQIAAFTLLGLGFYTMHASIQVTATELSSTARGAAMSLHAFFFFVGHAMGPILYGAGFVKLGTAITLSLAAVIALAIGLVTARLLRDRSSASDV